MENASKALIMSGGILIGIIIISIATIILNSSSQFVASHDSSEAQKQITMFNSKFEKYSGRNDLIDQDIKTVINLAREFNERDDMQGDKILIEVGSEKYPSDTNEYNFQIKNNIINRNRRYRNI